MTDLSALGAGTRGVWTRRCALAVLTPADVRARLDSGEWQVVGPGRYADGGVRLDAGQRAVAVTLGRQGAVAAGRTAARWWGFPLIDDDDPATSTFQHDEDDVAGLSTRTWTWSELAPGPTAWRATATTGQVRVVHERRLDLGPLDVVDIGGCAVLNPLCTLVDCARVLTHEALVCAIDDGLHRELVSLEELQSAAQALSGRGRREMLAAVAVADSRSESPLETLGRLLLTPVLPDLVPQVRVRDHAGKVVARLDLADEEARFGVEADGKGSHSKPRQVTRDVDRAHRVRGLGWSPLSRYSWWDARRRPVVMTARILSEFERWGHRAA